MNYDYPYITFLSFFTQQKKVLWTFVICVLFIFQ